MCGIIIALFKFKGNKILAKKNVNHVFLKDKLYANQEKLERSIKLYQPVSKDLLNNKSLHQELTVLKKFNQNNAIQFPPQETIEKIVNLFNQGQFSVVVQQAKALTEQYPKAFTIWNILGASAAQIGMIDDAISYYKKSISIKPDYAVAFNNMGTALKDKGELDEAIDAYKRSILLSPHYCAAYNNMGVALRDQGRLEEAMETFNKVLLHDPNSTMTYNNIGNVLRDQGKFDEAIEAYKKSILIKPDYAEAYFNMGITLKDKGKLEEALMFYNKALSLKPEFAQAYKSIGHIFNEQGEIEMAIENFKKALKINPNYEDARVNKLLNQAYICDWTGIEEDQKLIQKVGISDQPVVPWSMMTFEDIPDRQKIRSQVYAKKIIKQKTISMAPVPIEKPKRLRIGYFSSDFRVHSVIYLIADIIDMHDRERFEIYAYSFGPNDNSELRKRIVNSVDVFRDVKDMGDQDISILARKDKIDIAIDINGYTKLSRPNIFAYRAAPIQIHCQGSANSSGANFIDYVMIDNIRVPEEHDKYWCESIIRLPFWCQARYKKNYISDQLLTRRDMGLTENGFVFCSFNNNYKLSPIEFDIWMRILNKVEGSVLWLLKSNKWVQRNLQQEALKRGITSDRLVFAEKVPHSLHLARQRLADVFVDTFNVNAGVTAGDALWVGLPMVTKLGKGPGARFGATMLEAINMPELITKTEQEYEALLLHLATNPQRFSAIKEKLAANRLSTSLFDTKLFTKNVEKGYQLAYQRYFDGKDPKAISVSVT
jgi:protein O-GlcNAc transferase